MGRKRAGNYRFLDNYNWYVPAVAPADFKANMMNQYQLENLNLILLYKDEMGF